LILFFKKGGCVLIGADALIRSHTVYTYIYYMYTLISINHQAWYIYCDSGVRHSSTECTIQTSEARVMYDVNKLPVKWGRFSDLLQYRTSCN